jgi:hypothetical protein
MVQDVVGVVVTKPCVRSIPHGAELYIAPSLCEAWPKGISQSGHG